MIWFVVFVSMTIEARIHLDEVPADTYPSLWLDTEMLDAEWRDRYGTEPPACWLIMVGQPPSSCGNPEQPPPLKATPDAIALAEE